jgi:hypothetical protein
MVMKMMISEGRMPGMGIALRLGMPTSGADQCSVGNKLGVRAGDSSVPTV